MIQWAGLWLLAETPLSDSGLRWACTGQSLAFAVPKSILAGDAGLRGKWGGGQTRPLPVFQQGLGELIRSQGWSRWPGLERD